MKLLTAAIIIGIALAGAPVATAQQSNERIDQQKSAQDPAVNPAEKSAEELKVTDQELAKRVSDVNKATKFIGMRVKNPKNETVGKINDIALDLKSGRIAYAVVSVGGFLGVGDKLVAAPIEALTVEKGAKHLLLDVDKPQIEQAVGFSENTWPELDAVQSGKTIGFTVQSKTNQTTAVGAPGSESEQATDRAPSRPAQIPGSITNLEAVINASDPSQFEGKQVTIPAARVDQVSGGSFILIVSDHGKHVLVKAPQGAEQLKVGQKLNLTGTVRKMQADATQLGLDGAAAQKVQGHKVYIEATQLTPAQQR